MSKSSCPSCGAPPPLRDLYAGILASNGHLLAFHCRECGTTSDLLRGFGSQLWFCAMYALSVVAILVGGIELLAPSNLVALMLVAVVAPILVLPPLWAAVVLRRGSALPPAADLTLGRKAAHAIACGSLAFLILMVGIFAHMALRPLRAAPAAGGAPATAMLDGGALAWRCSTLDGEVIELADLSNEVVFLNVWATWCGPCVGEMPSIAALAEATRGQGVRFLVVSQERPETVRAFIGERGWDLPFATTDALPEALRTSAIPATFVLRGGRVLYQHVGAVDWNTERFRDWLVALTGIPDADDPPVR